MRGRHTIKFGTDIRQGSAERHKSAESDGRRSHSTHPGRGNAVASLLLGQVNAFTIDIQSEQLQQRAHIAEFFVGDEWKVTPRLQFNAGVTVHVELPVN